MDGLDFSLPLYVFGALALLVLCAFVFWVIRQFAPLRLRRGPINPILKPLPESWWESQAVFNPAALYEGGRVHLLYRAMGQDGISRIGYASSKDGVRFDERLPYPIYEPKHGFGQHGAGRKYGPLSYSQIEYPSGGGWGGAEDPRMIEMDGRVYVTFTAFDGWGFVRMALMSTAVKSFMNKHFLWSKTALMSPPNEMHKNWVIFPEKIQGKYAVLHSISPEIRIAFIDHMDDLYREDVFIKSGPPKGGRAGKWDTHVRGAGAPPLRTKYGWLLLYHANDEKEMYKYKVGAMLLDLKDPTKVLYRSEHPILEPDMWYENDWKPGIVYASGAVIKDNELFVYYGGGDKYIGVAKAPLDEFLHKLTRNEHAAVTPIKVRH